MKGEGHTDKSSSKTKQCHRASPITGHSNAKSIVPTQRYLIDKWPGFDWKVSDHQIIELPKLRNISTHAQILSGPMMTSAVCICLIMWALDKSNHNKYSLCSTQVYDLAIILPTQRKQASYLVPHIFTQRSAHASQRHLCLQWVRESPMVDLKGDADSAYSYFVPRMQDRLQCIYMLLSLFPFPSADRIWKNKSHCYIYNALFQYVRQTKLLYTLKFMYCHKVW